MIIADVALMHMLILEPVEEYANVQAKWVSSATSAWLQSWVGHPQASAVLPGEVSTVEKQ